MSLDEELIKEKIPRRSFLKKTVSTLGSIALAGWIGSGIGCKSSTGPEPPEPVPVQVTLNFEVYNHIQGYKNQLTKTAMSGEPVAIRVGELGVSGVDQDRIAVKEDGFGKLVKFSNTGEAIFTAPKQSMNYDVILFNAYPGVNYNWMDEQDSQLYLEKRNYVVYRKDYDGQTGPETPWREAFDQHNEALNLGWIQWGRIDRQPSAGSGDFSYGYGYCFGGMGAHLGDHVLIEQSLTGPAPMGIANAEIFENITCVDDITGVSSHKIITIMGGPNAGSLNEVGKHLLAYVFAKE
ncbi:MAG TPA: hypothetical protein VJ461_04215 [Candidatus Nanoarchaeia archaeon]|nr:hypothetical protein [Candidatus Nanoarchaeia archaeon]